MRRPRFSDAVMRGTLVLMVALFAVVLLYSPECGDKATAAPLSTRSPTAPRSTRSPTAKPTPHPSSPPPTPAPTALSPLIQPGPYEPDHSLDLALTEALQHAPPTMARTVIVVEVNSGFLDVTRNFILHVERLIPPLRNIVYAALDEGAAHELRRMKQLTYYPEIRAHEFVNATKYGGPGYNEIVRHKWRLALKLLHRGLHPFILDADVVLLRNPLNFMQDLPDCELTVTAESAGRDTLRSKMNRFGRWMVADRVAGRTNDMVYTNTGVMWMKPTLNLISALEGFVNSTITNDDQYEFNTLMLRRCRGTNTTVNLPLLQRARNCSSYGNFTMNIMSPVLFGSQRFILGDSLAEDMAVTPYVTCV